MTAPAWSLRSMGIDGYINKVQEHFTNRGFVGPLPSRTRYMLAWNAQTCAKKFAAYWIRRQSCRTR